MTDTSLIVNVAQILHGDPVCECGEPAVLVVTTEPDGDPGPACFVHAMEWISLTIGLARELYGPKAPEANGA